MGIALLTYEIHLHYRDEGNACVHRVCINEVDEIK
jgi:hypothetical protein